MYSVDGHQWYWGHGSGDSRMVASSGLMVGDVRLSLVDQPLFLVKGACGLLSVSSVDVIHCYSVPALGVKVDAIPGRVSWVTMSPLAVGYYSG